ncbi:MAG: DUF1707 and DUF2154 domain-containing protein [Gemmatimonadetes bacterium]|nr:DUF1707 and DUF2154 domain-containing protein [Gemmatimonadota bacterium]
MSEGVDGLDGIPAGDATRQKAVDALCEAFADDRISVEEFERRVELAHRAETLEELRALLRGLPAPLPARRPETSSGEESSSHEGAPTRPEISLSRHVTQPPEMVRPTSFIAGILGGGGRRGAWYPARVNYAIGFMGGFTLDLREAPLPPGVTEIRLFCFWGGGEVIVPPDVRVEVSVAGILGGVDYDHAVPGTLDPDAPVVRITGICLMGGAEIAVRYAGESAGDAKRRRKSERRSRKRAMRQLREGDRRGD